MNDEDRLADTLRALYKFYNEFEQIEVESKIRRSVVFAHGWYVSVLRTAKAIQVLGSYGLGHEAAPLRRSLMEHCIALHWLSEATEDAVNSILRHYRDNNLKRLKQSVLSESPEAQEMLDNILTFEIDESSEDYYVAFKHKCDRYGMSRMYLGWLHNTAFSHPTSAGALAYVKVEEDESFELMREPTQAVPDPLREVSGLLLVATGAMNRLVKGHPWDALIVDLEAKLAATIGLDLSQDQ